MACSFMVGTLESLRNDGWAPPMVAAEQDAGRDRGLGPRAVRRRYGYADPSSGHRHARSVAHGSSAPYSSAEPPPPGWRGRRPIDVAEPAEPAAQLRQHGLIDRVVLGDGDGVAFG